MQINSTSEIKITTLLVDDDAAFREELTEGLNRLGISVICAADAAEALSSVERNRDINIALVDIGLPKINGIELLRKLRLREHTRPLPVIILTGEATLDRAIAALRVDAVDFLQKPVDAYEIANTLRSEVIRNRKQDLESSTAFQTNPEPKDRLSALLSLRKERNQIFGRDLFEDPVWEMLLDLASADSRGKEVAVTSLCLASGVSTTTALRRIDDMVERGLVDRHRDPADGRRVLIRLTDKGREKIRVYLDTFGKSLNGPDPHTPGSNSRSERL